MTIEAQMPKEVYDKITGNTPEEMDRMLKPGYAFDLSDGKDRTVIYIAFPQGTKPEDVANVVTHWIPVTERLPELTEQIESDNYCVNYSKDVLIWSPMNMIPLFEIARYTDDRGWTDPYFTQIKFQGMITHWMQLPQPPEVEK